MRLGVNVLKCLDSAWHMELKACATAHGCCFALCSKLSRVIFRHLCSSVAALRGVACGRVYAAKAAEAAGDTRKKMRRLAQELRALQGAQGLPLQAAAAILLRHDGDRPDKMRALLTGAAACVSVRAGHQNKSHLYHAKIVSLSGRFVVQRFY